MTLGAALVALVVAVSVPTPPPVAALPEISRPDLTAATWVLYDVGADVVLDEHRSHESRPMASVTKIMTALVVRDHADLDDRVVVSGTAAAIGEAEIGLVPGETWTVAELLAAVMVRSGNDAAVALAEHVGGSVSGFASLMNAKAAELGLDGSQFANPHGLDADGHHTSAADLAVMAVAALEDPVLSRLSRTKVVQFRSDPFGIPRRAVNTNRLLGAFPGVVGMKTGFTGDAGRVLVSVAERHGRTLVAVVMGSEDHFADTRELLEFGFDTYGYKDRMMRLLVEEEGGGATSSEDVRNLTALVEPARTDRLRGLTPLDGGRWATTAVERTPLGEELKAWLRGILPDLLGGGG